MIQVSNLNLTIKQAEILSDINLNIERGVTVGLVGRNGSGKTMLMKCICGLINPTGGTVTVNGKQIGKDIDFPESLGLIIENPGFVGSYSGLKNLSILANYKKKITREQICETLKVVGLYDRRNMHVSKYSLGMKQRLGIAQAIMENPELLVLDEPFNGIDQDGLVSMKEVIKDLKKNGTTIILASHHSEDINELCDEVYMMSKGRLEKRCNP